MIKKINNIEFELKEDFDFTWLSKYGDVFSVFDKQDSGNICFGVKKDEKKVFIKYAGAKTLNYEGSYEEAVCKIKESIKIYKDIQHPNLIRLIDDFEVNNGHALVYEWVEGESLHAHWNFDKYPKYTHPKSPNYRLNKLPLEEKLKCLDSVFSFHKLVAEKNYVAIDFYDGSIIYDFINNKTTVCDIDFYSKSPFINTMGDMWGSKRFKSPEEFEKDSIIDEITNVYAMGALAFEILGDNKKRDFESWKGSESLYKIAKKAISNKREDRYKSINDFYNEWEKVVI